jgi:hypothetical protein
MEFLITFAATGGIIVEAEDEDEACEKFFDEYLEDAGKELVLNGIDITDVQKEW